MKKMLDGFVISVNMQKTAIVNVMTRNPHPLYKKLIKKNKKIKVDIGTYRPVIGDRVKIVETRPISSTKHSKIAEVIKDGSA